jgi:hypothetical protein
VSPAADKMRFFFSEEDELTRNRGREIRSALVHARHEVVRGRPGEAAPVGTDVWLYGMGVHGLPRLEEDVVRALLNAKSRVILFQLCDYPTMSFERIPEALLNRVDLFLRNHWPSDKTEIPESVRGRIGWLPPMLKAMAPVAGKPLAERSGGAIFFGSRTGLSLTLPDGKNAREETVRLMRASDLPFKGGLLPHAESRYHTAPELLVPRMKEAAHTRLLVESKLCLAPWGNHQLTYRFFEGMALRCLVIAQPVRDSAFLDGGLVAGTHYVEVSADLSDLTDIVRYYLSHLDEAQRIADAGHAHFVRYLASRGPMISQWMFEATVNSWGYVYRPSNDNGIAKIGLGLAARLFPKKF